MFCIIDIESTGGAFGKEAIIEIALFRYNGSEVVDQLISLIHPHKEIQQFVSKMTGITPKMLVRAPRFPEVAKRVLQLVEGTVLVGHNVEFDYRMLRQEFGRLGYPLEMKTLDTIPLAEKLIPELPSYGLNTVCKELGIFHSHKHRAEGDARATLELFNLLMEKDKEKDISILGQSILENDALKSKLTDLRRSVSFNRGIFYLHDREGKLLYMGTSDNIKNTLNRIFMAENEMTKKLREEVHSVKTEATGNWLVAKIKKIEEGLKARPSYNPEAPLKLKFGIFIDKGSKAKECIVKALDSMEKEGLLIKAETMRAAYRAIRMHRRNFPADRKEKLIDELKNFPEEAVYLARGRSSKERCAFIVQNKQLAGYFFFTLNDQIEKKERLLKNMTAIESPGEFTELLKLGILSGEFSKQKALE